LQSSLVISSFNYLSNPLEVIKESNFFSINTLNLERSYPPNASHFAMKIVSVPKKQIISSLINLGQLVV
jgi:hypothetical protein